MLKRLTGWYSPNLNRKLELVAYGHAGKPVLLFPTAGGDQLEAENCALIRAIRWMIEDGRARVYTCGSISGESWLSESCLPEQKGKMQSAFDRYISEELVPWIRSDVGDSRVRLIGAGASLGAYNAVNAHTKHPELFWLSLAMSGTYDFERWMKGYRDTDYYFNQPLLFVPNLKTGTQLDWLKQSFFQIASGRGRYEAPWESVRLGQVLGSKGIPNYVDLWGTEVEHDWPTWRTMLPVFLDRFV
jgi:esterase/lipase superfamily enzyme